MSDASMDEEKAVSLGDSKHAAGVEVRTNTRLRQKYFVDGTTILSSVQPEHFRKKERYSRVIRSPKVTFSNKPVKVRCNRTPLKGDIKVDVIRDGEKITGIKIVCPCGRHTELDCEYNVATPQKQET